ncbi:CFDP2 protein, partial [Polypterus senegalus]
MDSKPSMDEVTGFDKTKLKKAETVEKNPLPTKERDGGKPHPRKSRNHWRANRVRSVGDRNWCGAVALPTARLHSGPNLRRPIWVGAWNILSLRQDDHLPLLSEELRKLRISVAALSEVCRLGTVQISVSGYTFYWSGRSDGCHTRGVAVPVADWLRPMVFDVTPFYKRIMGLRLRHSLGALSVVSVYAPTAVSDVSARETFYSQLRSVVDGCPQGDTPLVMGDFIAATGTDTVLVPMVLVTVVKVAPCSLTLQKVRGCESLDPGSSALNRIIGLRTQFWWCGEGD